MERGNSFLVTAEGVGQTFAGAPLGALLFAVAVALPFYGAAGGYVAAALLILLLKVSGRQTRTGHTTFRADLREGLRWLRAHRLLRGLMWVVGIAAASEAMATGILVLYALEVLGASDVAFGILLAATGAGGIVGAILAPTASRIVGRSAALVIGSALAALATAAMGLVSGLVVACALAAVVGVGIGLFNVLVMSLRQALIPGGLFGRVQGAYRTVVWGGIPLGTVLGGALARWTNIPTVFVVSGLIGIGASCRLFGILRANRAQIAAAFETEADSSQP